jgi:hypothetical protein
MMQISNRISAIYIQSALRRSLDSANEGSALCPIGKYAAALGLLGFFFFQLGRYSGANCGFCFVSVGLQYLWLSQSVAASTTVAVFCEQVIFYLFELL